MEFSIDTRSVMITTSSMEMGVTTTADLSAVITKSMEQKSAMMVIVMLAMAVMTLALLRCVVTRSYKMEKRVTMVTTSTVMAVT
jgi:fatty-acid desaturase